MGNDKRAANNEPKKIKLGLGGFLRQYVGIKTEENNKVYIDKPRLWFWKPEWWTKKKIVFITIGSGAIITSSILFVPQMQIDMPGGTGIINIGQSTTVFDLPQLPNIPATPHEHAEAWEFNTWNDPEMVRLREEEKDWYRFCRDENKRNGMEASANYWQSRLDRCFREERRYENAGWLERRVSSKEFIEIARWRSPEELREMSTNIQMPVTGLELFKYHTETGPLSIGGAEKEECP